MKQYMFGVILLETETPFSETNVPRSHLLESQLKRIVEHHFGNHTPVVAIMDVQEVDE